ncbi:SRPBCC family protein [Streptomyces sp. NBC_01180]|uniref:SRPBCC family protein n=1 Tax=unclassified Streptomyces TaxID=2593676 RepID=UPI00386B7E05
MAPSRPPIHFTNEIDVPASPQTVWSLLTDPPNWPRFHPGHPRTTARRPPCPATGHLVRNQPGRSGRYSDRTGIRAV